MSFVARFVGMPVTRLATCFRNPFLPIGTASWTVSICEPFVSYEDLTSLYNTNSLLREQEKRIRKSYQLLDIT